MPIVSVRWFVQLAGAFWRRAPVVALDRFVLRVQQALAAFQGYGIENLEAEVAAACRQLPRRAAVIFDVGAHRGEWSGGVRALRAERDDRFFLFEPSALNLAKLQKLSPTHFTVVPVAVSDQCGNAPLFADAAGSGLGSLHQRDLALYGVRHERQEEVATTTLDHFADTNGIDRVDYLKIDVEGHELAVLRGARRLLAERRIAAIAFEFGGTQVDSRAFLRDYWSLLGSHGYRMHRVAPGGVLLPMARYDVALEIFRLTTYVALAGPE